VEPMTPATSPMLAEAPDENQVGAL
jgi:hypothetical protein